jgi:chromate transporter
LQLVHELHDVWNGKMIEVFKAFLLLGLVSFGGPAAHIGYFRNTFVVKKQWLDDRQYADLVALSQFLPGPGSSQVGFGIGYQRYGIKGAIAAFVGFTLPSVLLMMMVAALSSSFLHTPFFQSVIHGLKLLAVIVVTDAIWGMFTNFCRANQTRLICTMTAFISLIFTSVMSQVLLLVIAAALAIYQSKDTSNQHQTTIFSPMWSSLSLFILLFIGTAIMGTQVPIVRIFQEFFSAGSLVFGGGHVVLPLLQHAVGDVISNDSFLTGYAAAQAIPGPMFTFATYLGYLLLPSTPIIGALVATIAIFLPGFLLLLVVLKDWHTLSKSPFISSALKGVNAAVVGFLIAALYDPIFVSAVNNNLDFAFVLAGLVMLRLVKPPILVLVVFASCSGILLDMIIPLLMT